MLTPFGKVIRKLRIDRGLTLKEMAELMGKTSAYLSSVETGKKKITQFVIDKSVEILAGGERGIVNSIKDAAVASMKQINVDVDGANDRQREVAAVFARSFNNLTDEQLEGFMKIMEKKQ